MPEAVFTDPKVASVGTAKGDQVLTAVHMIEGARGSVLGRAWRPCFLGGADGTKESAIVWGVARGPAAGEWIGQLTLVVRARTPLDILLDTIQPYPTFSEAIFSALQMLEERL